MRVATAPVGWPCCSPSAPPPREGRRQSAHRSRRCRSTSIFSSILCANVHSTRDRTHALELLCSRRVLALPPEQFDVQRLRVRFIIENAYLFTCDNMSAMYPMFPLNETRRAEEVLLPFTEPQCSITSGIRSSPPFYDPQYGAMPGSPSQDAPPQPAAPSGGPCEDIDECERVQDQPEMLLCGGSIVLNV